MIDPLARHCLRPSRIGRDRSSQQPNDFSINATRDVIRGVVLDVLGTAELARPSSVRQLASGMSVEEAGGVKDNLLEIGFAIRVNRPLIAQRGESSLQGVDVEV